MIEDRRLGGSRTRHQFCNTGSVFQVTAAMEANDEIDESERQAIPDPTGFQPR